VKNVNHSDGEVNYTRQRGDECNEALDTSRKVLQSAAQERASPTLSWEFYHSNGEVK
jgi:hypothetical protein